MKRAEECERRIRFFRQQCENFNLTFGSGDVEEEANAEYEPQVLAKISSTLEQYESQLLELNSFNEKLTREYNEKVELQEVLVKGKEFYSIDGPALLEAQRTSETSRSSLGGISASERGTESLLTDDRVSSIAGGQRMQGGDMRFDSVTGVIEKAERTRFERMIFRSTRGNCYIRFSEIEDDVTDPVTGAIVKKEVFIIFFKSSSIERKVKKICDAFSANRYSIPSLDDPQSYQRMLTENAGELRDSHAVLVKNQETRFRMCKMLSGSLQEWTWKVLKEKAIYHSLNMFKSDVSGMLRGEGWIITSELESAKEAVSRAHSNMDLSMPSLLQPAPKPWPQPPTHFHTNSFTYAYQEFVNTYGVPRYQEANPALFTAATFPFLFGVMYGDIGHGSCLFAGGCYLMYTHSKNSPTDEMVGGMYSARYMITAMGFFAIYAGLMYNDFFSLGLNWFTSRYYFEGQDEGASAVENGAIATLTSEYGTSDAIYPIGLDPAWHVSSNELLFFNSFKMKLSVILGIIQMFAGTCLKGMNALYFNEKLDFFFEFLPMVAFSSSLFLYMIVLIVMKWSINWNSRMLSASCCEVGGMCHPVNGAGTEWGSSQYEGTWDPSGNCAEGDSCTPWGYNCEGSNQLGGDVQYTTAELCPLDYGGSGDGCQPPNLITLLINIALQPGDVDEPLYKGQPAVQNLLLAIAFISVPLLLFAKPYFLSKQHESEHGGSHRDSNNSDSPLTEADDDAEDDGHSFGEVMIHQAIETIEFVLGMVSNTASYLRLWALSLAHSKLAGVFWEKAMLSTININFFAAFFGFGIFAAVTTGVLLMMDVLECFLHALRLHWVEFQNKFYKADGVRFVPFSFKAILSESAL